MTVSYDVDDPQRAVLIVGTATGRCPCRSSRRTGNGASTSKAGKQEILARRIGGNELDAISLLRGYVEAQKEYAWSTHDGPRCASTRRNGSALPASTTACPGTTRTASRPVPWATRSPRLLAAGYTKKAEPYNGYYFRTLTAQGPAARLGARNYIVKGMMIGGFAAIAWPANYGVTGVQTFLVNNDGVVYQKDLGPDTAKIAAGIKRFNPDKGWTVTEDEE